MQDRRILWGVIGALGLVMIALLYLNFLHSRPEPQPVDAGEETAVIPTPPSQDGEGSSYRVTLYFEGEDTELLYPEIREIENLGTQIERIRLTVEELIKGPTKNLLPVVPAEARLLDLFMLPDGLLSLNFSQDLRSSHVGGSASELRTLYSVVDTVVVNFPEVRSVQFLIEGRQEPTLAGHVSISRPVYPDWSLLSIR